MNLNQYLQSKYKNKPNWFVEEVQAYENYARTVNVQKIKEYIDGQHDILNRPTYVYNGETVTPRRIVVQLAKSILNFKTQYVLKNPVTLIGDESMLKEFNKVNKLAKLNDVNTKILSHILKFGEVSEYLYLDKKGRIQSKLISAENGTPIYNHQKEMIAFIEHYTFDGISYYNVYSEESVAEYSNEGQKVQLIRESINLSGLPIHYKSENELSDRIGRSDLEDYKNILDNIEDVISKYTDALYKFMNPIPVISGQVLTGASIPSEIVGAGLSLDDGATFTMVGNKLDNNSFSTVYKTLMQSLLDVSGTPSVAFNKADISNVSEISVRMMFSLANISASVNEGYLRDGFFERWEKVVELLKYKGITITEDELVSLEFNFNYDTPANHKEILDNMKTQFDMNAISLETILERSPYIDDSVREMSRIKGMAYEAEVIQ